MPEEHNEDTQSFYEQYKDYSIKFISPDKTNYVELTLDALLRLVAKEAIDNLARLNKELIQTGRF